MSAESRGFQGYHVVCLSPLAKIFQRRYHNELMKNPMAVFDAKAKFDIVADKPSGNLVLPYAQVVDLTKYFGRSTNEDRKIIDCFNWLTGGENGDLSRETNKTGCVIAPVDLEMVDMAIQYTQLQSEDEEAAEKFKKKMLTKGGLNAGGMKKAREMSDRRVMEAVRTVYENMKKQKQLNKESGLGDYVPSPTEFLCAYVLSAEEKKTAKDREEITKQFAELMDQAITPSAGVHA